MGKWKSSFDSTSEPESLEGGFTPYDGPALPFTGVFPFKLKRLRMKQNRNGDDMLNGLLEVYAPSKNDPKHKWHGAPLWFNLNQTAQGAPYTKAFIEAFGVKWAEFVKMTLLDEDQDPPVVTRLGKLKLTGEQTVKVSLKGSRTSEAYPEKKAEVASWLRWDGKDAQADDDLEDEDDDEVDYDEDGDEDDDEGGSEPPF